MGDYYNQGLGNDRNQSAMNFDYFCNLPIYERDLVVSEDCKVCGEGARNTKVRLRERKQQDVYLKRRRKLTFRFRGRDRTVYRQRIQNFKEESSGIEARVE